MGCLLDIDADILKEMVKNKIYEYYGICFSDEEDSISTYLLTILSKHSDLDDIKNELNFFWGKENASKFISFLVQFIENEVDYIDQKSQLLSDGKNRNCRLNSHDVSRVGSSCFSKNIHNNINMIKRFDLSSKNIRKVNKLKFDELFFSNPFMKSAFSVEEKPAHWNTPVSTLHSYSKNPKLFGLENDNSYNYKKNIKRIIIASNMRKNRLKLNKKREKTLNFLKFDGFKNKKVHIKTKLLINSTSWSDHLLTRVRKLGSLYGLKKTMSYHPRNSIYNHPWKRSIIVSNLHPKATYSDVKAHFELISSVQSIQILQNPGGLSKNYSIIEFLTKKDSDNAMKLDRSYLLEREIRVYHKEKKGLHFKNDNPIFSLPGNTVSYRGELQLISKNLYSWKRDIKNK